LQISSEDGTRGPQLNINAANATLLLTGNRNWEEQRGILLEIDHFNPETALKETRVKDCEKASPGGETKCETLMLQVCISYFKISYI